MAQGRQLQGEAGDSVTHQRLRSADRQHRNQRLAVAKKNSCRVRQRRGGAAVLSRQTASVAIVAAVAAAVAATAAAAVVSRLQIGGVVVGSPKRRGADGPRPVGNAARPGVLRNLIVASSPRAEPPVRGQQPPRAQARCCRCEDGYSSSAASGRRRTTSRSA